MKNILIITSGFLPLPAVDGGAVANLTENYIRYNEKKVKYNFVSYSVMPKSVDYKSIKNLKHAEFRFIQNNKMKNIIFKIISKLSKHKFPNYFIYSINKDLKKRSEYYDYIIVENNPGLIPHVKKQFGKKIILHVHNDWLNTNTQYCKRIVNKCDKIITVSEFVKKRVLEIEKNNKVSVVLNGIDNERFKPINDFKTNEKTKEKYGISDRDLVAIFTGKLKPEKGALEAITAFYNVNKKYENIKLLMVGSSFNKTDDDTEYILNIKKMTKDNKNIIFTGFVDYNEIHKLYSIADIQIVPSIVEDSCPLVVIEGMSAGLALITTISGGIPELVNNKCAFQLKRDKDLIKNISEKLEELLTNKSLLKEMKKESFINSKNFSNEKFCSEFLAEIEK